MKHAAATKIALASAGLMLAAFALAGCESTAPIPTPTATQVVGTWSHGSSKLNLDADHEFALTGVPEGVVKQTEVADALTAPKGPLVDVSGTWKIGSGGNDAGGAPAVQLTFVKPAHIANFGALTMLVAGYTDSDRQLYVDLGDPDAHIAYSYTK